MSNWLTFGRAGSGSACPSRIPVRPCLCLVPGPCGSPLREVLHYFTNGCNAEGQTHVHRGPHQPHGCLQRAEIILGLYKFKYCLTVKELKLHLAL